MRSTLPHLSPARMAAHSRIRMPTQLRRLIPIYIFCLCFLVIFVNIEIAPLRTHCPKVVRRSSWDAEQNAEFPRKIWQIWKTDPFAFAERDLLRARTWPEKNPDYRYEVLTDENSLAYIEQLFGRNGLGRQDIVDTYSAIKLPIVKADLLRYLIMYAEGGVYADIDVEALRPVHKFIPERHNEADIDMVIGVEIDEPDFKDHPILGVKSRSFCQWTFMSKPHHPVLLKLVDGILAWLYKVARAQNVKVSEVSLDFNQIIDGTGPSAFTREMLDYMSQQKGRTVTWDDFHDLNESKLVHGILVQNVEVFAAGQGHSNSGNHGSRGVLVKHHYHASNWPVRHARFAHSVYGEVERCNWEAACVARWDANVAAYDKLSIEEQRMKLAEVSQDVVAIS